MDSETLHMHSWSALRKIGSIDGPYAPENTQLTARNLTPVDDATWKALNTLICLPYFFAILDPPRSRSGSLCCIQTGRITISPQVLDITWRLAEQ
jgi:hypothetical protein